MGRTTWPRLNEMNEMSISSPAPTRTTPQHDGHGRVIFCAFFTMGGGIDGGDVYEYEHTIGGQTRSLHEEKCI
jgi:hypothetical protein